MGADLIWTAVRWPRTPSGAPVAGSDALAATLLARVEAAVPALSDAAREALDGSTDDHGDQWEADLITSLAEFLGANFSGGRLWRDCDRFSPEDAPWSYLFTACLSWGDATEAFDPINALVLLEVTTEPIDLPAEVA